MHASGKCQIDFALPETRSRLVYGHKRCRAGHVERHRRPHEPERKRNPPDGHAGGSAEIAVIPARGRDQVPVLAATQAGEHARAAALERSGIDSRVLERVPARLEQHPLARVHHSRLDRLDAEEFRVEPVKALKEPASANRGFLGARVSDDAAPGAVIGTPVGHGVSAGLELAPVAGQVRGTGEAACHADNRDPFPGHFATPPGRSGASSSGGIVCACGTGHGPGAG